ncbi:MAG: nucleotidyltransferase family protein [Rhodospirillales bacterium]|nr:nucleotidyltransferase family protein [Rhodospirillales bacterium]MBO6786843.1 nucleotidyltransferase family protein [Rhodospirillales bacterium]
MSETALSNIDVVVLAGGLGTRIQPVLGDVPKLLAPVNERTYLDYLLDWLQGFGARRVILSLGHQATRIVDYVTAMPRDGMEIVPVIEDAPLGTAGALRHVRPHVQTGISLVMNGDSWIDADLGMLVQAHEAEGAPATLLCVRVPDAGRFGQIETDSAGRIRAFREKDPDAGAGLINAGVYAFGPEAWDLLADMAGPSLERDVFQTLPPSSLAAYDAGDVTFIDIGTPDSLARAARVIGGAAADRGTT